MKLLIKIQITIISFIVLLSFLDTCMNYDLSRKKKENSVNIDFANTIKSIMSKGFDITKVEVNFDGSVVNNVNKFMFDLSNISLQYNENYSTELSYKMFDHKKNSNLNIEAEIDGSQFTNVNIFYNYKNKIEENQVEIYNFNKIKVGEYSNSINFSNEFLNDFKNTFNKNSMNKNLNNQMININNARKFFKDFGTHYISKVEIGAMKVERIVTEKRNNTDLNELQLKLYGVFKSNIKSENTDSIQQFEKKETQIGEINDTSVKTPNILDYTVQSLHRIINLVPENTYKEMNYNDINELYTTFKMYLKNYLKSKENEKNSYEMKIITDVYFYYQSDNQSEKDTDTYKSCINLSNTPDVKKPLRNKKSGVIYPAPYKGSINGSLRKEQMFSEESYLCYKVKNLKDANSVVVDIDVTNINDNCPMKKGYSQDGLQEVKWGNNVSSKLCIYTLKFSLNESFENKFAKLLQVKYVTNLRAIYKDCVKEFNENDSQDSLINYQCLCDTKNLNYGDFNKSFSTSYIYFCFSKYSLSENQNYPYRRLK